MKNETKKYYKNITVIRDRKYSRSYGNEEKVLFNFAILKNDWLECDGQKMNIKSKHFHNFEGRKIKESTYKRNIAKKTKAEDARRKNERKARAKKELKRIENQKEISKKLDLIFSKNIDKIKNIKILTTCKGSRKSAFKLHCRLIDDCKKEKIKIQNIRDYIRNRFNDGIGARII